MQVSTSPDGKSRGYGFVTGPGASKTLPDEFWFPKMEDTEDTPTCGQMGKLKVSTKGLFQVAILRFRISGPL